MTDDNDLYEQAGVQAPVADNSDSDDLYGQYGMKNPNNDMGYLNSIYHGLENGFGSKARGLLQITDKELSSLPGFVGRYGQNLLKQDAIDQNKSNENYQLAKQSHPLVAGLSNFIGDTGALAPLALIPGIGEEAIGESISSPLLKAIAQNLTKLPVQGAIGSALDYVNPGESRLKNAKNGALSGAVLSGILPVAGSGINKAFEKISPDLIQPFMQKLSDSLKPVNDKLFPKVSNVYDQYNDVEQNAWDKLKGLASGADMLRQRFDNTAYKKRLMSMISEIKKNSSGQSGYARDAKDAIDTLSGYLNDNHSTFSDAVEHAKALNLDLRGDKKLMNGNPVPFGAVKRAIDAFNDTIGTNFENDRLPKLNQAWQDARDISRTKNELFNQTVSNKGKTGRSAFNQIVTNKNQYAPQETFINDYLPKSPNEGIGKMVQFSRMMRDYPKAQQSLRGEFFRNAYDGDSFNANKFFSRFNKLGDDQKKYLFDSNQIDQLSKVNNLYQKNPQAFGVDSKNSDFASKIKSILSNVSGTALGGYAGSMVGGPIAALGGALLGYAIPKAVKQSVQNVGKNKNIQNMVLNEIKPTDTDTIQALRLLLPSIMNKL